MSGTDEIEARMLVVYRETIRPLYAYVSRCCYGDRSLAEDVTQEAWLRAVREWRRKGPPERPLAWLTTVARNLLISYYRRKKPAPLESASAAEFLEVRDDGEAARSEQITTAVGHAMSRLPDAEARLLEAFHFENRRVAEIAEGAGTSERAIEGRLRRARERLKRELQSFMALNGGKR